MQSEGKLSHKTVYYLIHAKNYTAYTDEQRCGNQPCRVCHDEAIVAMISAFKMISSRAESLLKSGDVQIQLGVVPGM